MKYLQRFNESNTSEVTKEDIEDLEDYFLDLKDEWEIAPSKWLSNPITAPKGFNLGDYKFYYHFYLPLIDKIALSKVGSNTILWSSISEYIDRIISYLEVENWDLVDMFLGGDQVIYPEQTIKNLNKIPKYTLDSVSFIFTEKEKSGDLIKSKEEFVKQFTDAANIQRIKFVK